MNQTPPNRSVHFLTLVKITCLVLLAFAIASPAAASQCTAQAETIFENCLESMGSDGNISAYEEGVCSSLTADIKTECERLSKPQFQPLSECTRSWSVAFQYIPATQSWTLLFAFFSPLSCI